MDKIKARLIELVPEIVELKSHCIFKWNSLSEFFTGTYEIVGFDGQETYMAIQLGNPQRDIEDICKFNSRDFKKLEIEILGRPIQLNDVLRAIDKPVKYYSGVKTPTIKIDVVRLLAIWNLAEHFDNQIPEVKAFLGKLLGVTE